MASAPGAAGPGAGYPQWYVNMSRPDKPVQEVSNAQSKAIAETTTFPATLIFFTSQQSADAYSKSHGGTGAGLGPGTSAAQKAVASTAAAVTSLNPLAGLFQANLWIRVAEFGVGAIMICVGLAKLGESSPAVQKIVSATPAGRVAKLAGVVK